MSLQLPALRGRGDPTAAAPARPSVALSLPRPAPAASNLVLIFVKVFGPDVTACTLHIDADLCLRVSWLRDELSRRLPDLALQRLLYAGRLLTDDERQMRECELYKEATVQALMRPKTSEEREQERRARDQQEQQQQHQSPAKRKWSFLRRRVVDQFSPPPKPRPARAAVDSDAVATIDAMEFGEAIVVEVVSARDLRAAGWSGRSDPYVLCCLQGASTRSTTRRATREPEWRETLGLWRQIVPATSLAQNARTAAASSHASPLHRRDRLHVLVFAHDRFGRDEPLGFVEFDVDHLPRTDEAASVDVAPVWHRLQGAPSGEVLLRVRRARLSSPAQLALFQTWTSAEKPLAAGGVPHPDLVRAGFSVRALRGVMGDAPFLLPATPMPPPATTVAHAAHGPHDDFALAHSFHRTIHAAVCAAPVVVEHRARVESDRLLRVSHPPSSREPSRSFSSSSAASSSSRRHLRAASGSITASTLGGSMLSSPLLHLSSSALLPAPPASATPAPTETWNPALSHLERVLVRSLHRQGSDHSAIDSTSAPLSPLFSSAAGLQRVSSILVSQRLLLPVFAAAPPPQPTRFFWITQTPAGLSRRDFHRMLTHRIELAPAVVGHSAVATSTSLCIKHYAYSPEARLAYVACSNTEQAVLAMLRLRSLMIACDHTMREPAAHAAPIFVVARKMRRADLDLLLAAPHTGFIYVTPPACDQPAQTTAAATSSSASSSVPSPSSTSSLVLLHLSSDGVLSGFSRESLFPSPTDSDAGPRAPTASFVLNVATRRRDASAPSVSPMLLLRTAPAAFELVSQGHTRVFRFHLEPTAMTNESSQMHGHANMVGLHQYALGKSYVDAWVRHLKSWRHPSGGVGSESASRLGDGASSGASDLVQELTPTFRIRCTLCACDRDAHDLYRLDAAVDAAPTCRACLVAQASLLTHAVGPTNSALTFSTLDMSDLLDPHAYEAYLDASTRRLLDPVPIDAALAPTESASSSSAAASSDALSFPDLPYTRCPACHAHVAVDEVTCDDTSLLSDEAQLSWWQKQTGVDGRPPPPESYAHFVRHRVLCRNHLPASATGSTCGASFCRLCHASPYHVGLECGEFREFAAAPKCRFCLTAAVTARNHLVAPPSAALEQVCGHAECEAKSRISCLRTHGDGSASSSSSSSSAHSHSCGHVCRGVRNESVCLPCLDPACVSANPSLTCGEDADSECAVCFAEPLGSAPALMLGCGHLVHFACVLRKIAANWTGDVRHALNATLLSSAAGKAASLAPSAGEAPPPMSDPRIHFGCLACPLCARRMVHPSLDAFIAPYLAFERVVHARAADAFTREGLRGHDKFERFASDYQRECETAADTKAAQPTPDDALVVSNTPPVEVAFALDVLNFYQCSQCEKPYFAGSRECGPAGGGERHVQSADLLCSSCKAQSSFDCCETHGADWVMYKCRFCCRPSTYHCWDSAHFCDVCHHQDLWPDLCMYATGQNLLPIYEYPQCPGLATQIAAVLKDKRLRSVAAREAAVRGLFSDPSTCPLGVRHSPNGVEFGLGCAMCRDQKADAQNARNAEAQAQVERDRIARLRQRLAHLIPNERGSSAPETSGIGPTAAPKDEAVWLLPAEVREKFVAACTSIVANMPACADCVYDFSEQPLPPSLHTEGDALDRDAPFAEQVNTAQAVEEYELVDSVASAITRSSVDQPHSSRSQSLPKAKLLEDGSQPIAAESPLARVDNNRPRDATDGARGKEVGVVDTTAVVVSHHGRRAKFLQRTRAAGAAIHSARPPMQPQPPATAPTTTTCVVSASHLPPPSHSPSSVVSSSLFLAPWSHLPATAIHAIGLVAYLATDNRSRAWVNPCEPVSPTSSAVSSSSNKITHLCDFSLSSAEEGQSGACAVFDGEATPHSVQTRDLPLSSIQLRFHHLALRPTHYAISVPSAHPVRSLAASQREAASLRVARANALALSGGKAAQKALNALPPPPPPGDPNLYLTSWRLEASNAGVHWDVLDERVASDALAPLEAVASRSPEPTTPPPSSSIFSWHRARKKVASFSDPPSSSSATEETATKPHRRVVFAIPHSLLSPVGPGTSSSGLAVAPRYTLFRIVQTDLNSLGSHVLPCHGLDLFGQCLPAVSDAAFLSHAESARASEVRRRLRAAGGCFTLAGDGVELTAGLDVPLSERGRVVQNLGSAKWRAIRVEHPMVASPRRTRFRVSFTMLHDPPTSNSWHFNVGVVGRDFDLAKRCWIGAQKQSWGYIAGTGGICNESGISTKYGSPYGLGDVVTLCLDYSSCTLEFFLNGVSQGIAFNDIDASHGPLYPAVSLHAVRAQVRCTIDE